jgi:hypothetical protein
LYWAAGNANQLLRHVDCWRHVEIRSSIDADARHNLRWATAGMEVCRVAGSTPIRSGNLLSP